MKLKHVLMIFALLLIGFLTTARAAGAPIELDLKVIKLVLPFQETYAPYLYDVVHQQNMIGLETPIAKSGRIRFVVGAADVEGPQEAMPYLGADVDTSEKYFGQKVNVGGWIAYDSTLGERRGGVKASIQLW